MREVIPRTRKGTEWNGFADKVLTHIDTYVVPQYGDKGEDEVTEWTAKDCMMAIKKYAARFGKNSRKGQEKLDILKIAHYACLIYNKLEEGG